MLSTSLRLGIASKKIGLTSLKHSFNVVSKKTFAPAVFNSYQTRGYSAKDNKQVSYTVDKFPGYIRNENFKEVFQR